jgi:hypothetical protein
MSFGARVSGHGQFGAPIATFTIDTFTSVDDTSGQTATITVKSDGTVVSSNLEGLLQIANWFTPTQEGAGNGYYVQITRLSGAAFTSNAASSVVSLAANKAAYLTRTTTGTSTIVYKIEIFSDSGGTTLVSQESSVTMSATVLPS